MSRSQAFHDRPGWALLPTTRCTHWAGAANGLPPSTLARQAGPSLPKNYRFGRREIDLIVQKGPLLAFVEVKTPAGGGCGHPEEAVTWRKRREIEAVAEEYLVRNARSGNQVRFDVIAIEVAADGRVTGLQHLEDAWRQAWP